MIATYRLSEHLASFEFFLWLVQVKAMGATKIVFDISNPKSKKIGGPEHVLSRFYSIIEPGPALAGLPARTGNDAGRLNAAASQFIYWYRSGNSFARLETVKPAIKCDYTITIRKHFLGKGRNSNEEAWRRFGENIGAVMIEDHYVKPIHLHDRMALYAGAKMNFGVSNGPIFLITLTKYPMTEFINGASARNNVIRGGIRFGEQLPWMLPNQHLVWQEDSYDNLRRYFDGMRC